MSFFSILSDTIKERIIKIPWQIFREIHKPWMTEKMAEDYKFYDKNMNIKNIIVIKPGDFALFFYSWLKC